MSSEPSSSSLPSISHPQYRRRRSSRPSASSHYPSSGLLALLATVASSTQANASPISLSFLCPGLDDRSLLQDELPHHHPESAESQQLSAKGRRAHLPDRYVQGADGLWRKSGWSLYGSSMCLDCQDMSTTTPQVDNSVDTSTSASSTTSSPAPATTTPTEEFMNSLPPGWKPIHSRDNTGIILSISLSLAFFICLVMVLCIFWRRVAKHTPDVEKRWHRSSRRKLPQGDDTEAMIEKAIQTRTKVLARATARWKANARQAFRQRRIGRKNISPSDSEEADTTPTISHTHSTVPENESFSPASSRRSSLSSAQTHIIAHTTARSATQSLREVCLVQSSSAPSIPPSPPAYPHHPLPETTREENKDDSTSSTNSQIRFDNSSLPSDMHSANQSIQRTAHMAHVATDDKSLLARLDQLVSAPEIPGILDISEYPAPVWRDEELSDFTQLGHQDTAEASAPSGGVLSRSNADAMFPPPPTHFSSSEKGKAAESYPFEYSYHSSRRYSYGYGESILDVEPEAGPSAPPFETALDAPGMHPSAPPLEAEQLNVPHFPLDDNNSLTPVTVCEETVSDESHGENSTPKEDLASSSENTERMCLRDDDEGSISIHNGLPPSKNVEDPDGASESSP
ncbi:hypothetical protein GYMLUDRAFT_282464 [Collybiopsis luxurians FD-317 M1]|nr:hypothetical protein GYMLUDRAFT_282464 [Collybiopsis luxurians FD-317 M1]